MKRLMIITLVLVAMTGCGHKKTQNAQNAQATQTAQSDELTTGEQMLQMLNQQSLSLLVYNDTTLTTHDNRGIHDLLQLLAEQPERLKGAIVADKLVGKAAAAIMATGGGAEVHTNIISTPARELLEKEGVRVFATEEVPQILNRDRSGMCPIDTQIAGVESIDECVKILQQLPVRP